MALSLWAEGEGKVADKIVIDGTWMTRDFIILSKLGFKEGDSVTQEDLEKAEKELYRLNLFSKVEFTWDEEEDGTTTLHVLARDQFLIMPLVAIDGSSSTIKLGAADENFLGFNVDLSLAYEQEKQYSQYDFIKRRIRGSVGLPDTLLNGFTFGQVVNIGLDGNAEHEIKTDFSLPTRWFNDWLWRFYFSKSLDVIYDAEDGVKLSGYSDSKWDLHTIFKSDWDKLWNPRFEFGWYSSEIGDTGLVDVGFDGIMGANSYLYWSSGITYGEVRTKNSYFQKNGWKVFADYSMDIKTAGDNSFEPLIHDFSIGAEAHWLAFNWLEFAGYLNYGVSNLENNYRIPIHNTRDRSVPGLTINGSTFYSLTAQAHVTYVNVDWFALEHVAWFDLARAGIDSADLFSTAPKMAVGTGLRFRIPNIPWLYFYIDIQWALPETGQDFWGIKI